MNSQFSASGFKIWFAITLGARKSVSERKTDTGALDGSAIAEKMLDDPAKKVRAGKDDALLANAQNAIAGGPLDASALIRFLHRAGGTAPGYNLHINSPAGILHLLVWFGFVRLLFHAVQSCLHMICHSLSTVRIYLRFRIRAHNPTMPG